VSKRVCIFIDGENFRKSIVKLFERFRPEDYLPRQAKWADLFDFLIDRTTKDGERVRTYWYVIKQLDFTPYQFPKVELWPSAPEYMTTEKVLNGAKKILCKGYGNPYKEELNKLRGDELKVKLEKIIADLRARRNIMSARFNGWTNLQDGIATKWDRIEFRRAGAITYNLFTKQLGTEKAVDVKLATDLIMLRDIYDVAIIVSGDQDYVPAVEEVKDLGKTVINVSFEARNGKLLPGGARRLNQITDSSLHIKYEELSQFLRISPAS
jgi:uncharacterized LabA/DUF88 family protein